MKILIFGASGKTGRHLVSQALERGHCVTAFVRDPEKLSIRHEKLRVIKGDVADYSKTEEAIKDHQVVLSALGAQSPFKYDPVVVQGMNNIIRAMESNGVKRLIYLSFIGVKESRKDGGFMIRYIAPRLLKNEIAGHEAREIMIRKSKLDWTIVKAPKLTNGIAGKNYRNGLHLKANSFVASLSRADVADFMLQQITNGSYIGLSPRIMK